MNLDQLIQIIQNRVSTLERALTENYSMGNIEQYYKISDELEETKLTLKQLVSIIKKDKKEVNL